jgi:GT2 family glycosyltransferase
MKWPKVFVIILNWNGWKDTIECLESLYRISYPNYDVIVVDNGSQDDSVAKIRAYAQGEIETESSFFSYNRDNKPLAISEYARNEVDGIKELSSGKKPESRSLHGIANQRLFVIRNERNFGFSEGNNIAIRYALRMGADYTLLLNNDTVVHKDFLTVLEDAARRDQRIGAIGPKVYWYADQDKIQCTGMRFDLWKGREIAINWSKTDLNLDIEPKNGLLPVDYISGVCFLVKRKVIEHVGGLDPMYFLYHEEADWCFRSRRAGYKIVCHFDAKIWHKGMASSAMTKRFSQYYPARNRVIFMRKYARTSQFISFLMYHPLYYIAWLLKNGQPHSIFYYIKGFVAGLLMPVGSSSLLLERV